MLNLRNVDVFLKFCIVGALAALTLVVHTSSSALSNSVQQSSEGIEQEIRNLKNTLNITQIESLIAEIRNLVSFIDQNMQIP